MFHILGQAIFGLIVGLVARFLLPGRDPAGIVVTALLGMAGGWLGGRIGKWLGWYEDGSAAGFGMSVVGAMILFFAYRFVHV
jgi:uncharacterized membrane protein YeaQ/YmgE (transglycosylase-associated protein family)